MNYWRSLHSRERLLLCWGFFSLVATLLYVSILEPRYQRLSVLRLQVPIKQQDLAWMKSQVKLNAGLLHGQSQKTVKERLPLLTIVEKTATSSKLREHIARMQPAQNGAVRVWFNDVQFNTWISWLEVLRKQGIAVDTASISREGDGTASVRITLVQAS